MTDEEVCGPPGLTVQEAGANCPGAGLRERQKLAANRFYLQESIEVTDATRENDPEKSFYI